MAESDIQVVDNSNFKAYVDDKLNVAPSPEEQATQELAKVEAEKAERIAAEKAKDDPTHDLGESVPEEKKKRLSGRITELTDARKAAEERAEKATQEAKEARERAQAMETERNALKAKYEPPKEQEAEPTRAEFQTDEDFAKSLKEWTADNTRREDAKKASDERRVKEQEAIQKAWTERQTAFRSETPDYEQVVGDSDIKLHEVVLGAINESDIGPQLLYHLAKNPDAAAPLQKGTIAQALRELGKLEAKLGTPPKGDARVTDGKVIEISKAPLPISPLTKTVGAATILKGSDDIPAGMTYDQWREKRAAGQIK